jgi:molybdopterin-guanine dinucleotide biosynthesis protein A
LSLDALRGIAGWWFIREVWGDKYLWRVEGRPLISIAASAVRSVSDRVLLLVRDRERASQLLKELPTHIDEFIIDDPGINCSGPLRGMLTALFHVEADEYLIVPGICLGSTKKA